MRKLLVLSVAVLALVGLLAPVASAQAPGPKFEIQGLIDTVTSWSKNLRDTNFARTGDSEWYARNRGRFDIIGYAGGNPAYKGVLGIEIDEAWGQVSATDSFTGGTGAGTAQRAGTLGAFDLNTDTRGIVEIKWLYVEFPAPMMPWPTVIRLGAQPFAVTYKVGTLATGDFAGTYLSTTVTPNVKLNFTYAAIEENLQGGSTGGSGATTFVNGDDFALFFFADVTPMKGLDIRPIYSYAQMQGGTHGNARVGVGGIPGAGGTPTFANKLITPGGVAAHIENRHTIGVDARWRSGPWSLDPTFFYQFGNRDVDNPFSVGTTNLISESDISAFLIDIKAGYRWGPLLLEGRYLFASGNRPQDQLSRDTNYFQPINTDTSYGADGWGQVWALGYDYFNGAIRTLGTGIGYDRYGRQGFGVKGTYSWTPSFDVWALVMPQWTHKKVDTDGTHVAGVVNCSSHSANSPAFPRGSGCRGDENYLGTETDLGITWRFAPGLTFDLVGAILWAGDALDVSEVRNGVLTQRGAVNVYTIASRVRYTF